MHALITVHIILGIIVLILAVITSILEVTRRGSNTKNPLRGPLIGLLDLQILLGIIAIIWSAHYGWFLIHPIIMIIAAVIFHGWTKANRPRSARIAAYVIPTILLIVGVALFG